MQQKSSPLFRIAVICTDPAQQEIAEQLAAKLGLPFTVEVEEYDFLLLCTGQGLQLYRPGDPALTSGVRVDFVQGATGYRLVHGGSEMLIRAIGHKMNAHTTVLDATGGLGRDTFIMAAHGCHVHIMEKNRIVAALLEDGLHRAAENDATREICSRIRLTIGDSYHQLVRHGRTGRYDVIYLDPMFPKRSKSALVKKELQALQLLVGNEDDMNALFEASLQAAGKRVVVKRPKSSPPLDGRAPSHSLGGRTTRFDVYLTG